MTKHTDWKNKELIAGAVAQVFTYTDAVKLLGLRPAGRNIQTLQKYIKYHNIDDSHFNPHKATSRNRLTIPLDEILEGKHPQYKTYHLKHRMLDSGALTQECAECGVGTSWNGKKLVLQLDHIDGDNTNHRRSNLQLLCPNCHTQTNNWGNKARN